MSNFIKRRMRLGVLLVVLCISVFISAGGLFRPGGPAASHGIIDLTSWNFSSQGNVTLDGEWEFYPGILLKPGAIPAVKQYTKVPAALVFSDSGLFDDHKSRGFGTYRLLLHLPESSGPMALYIRQVFTAADVYANGKLVYRAGTVGRSLKDSIPLYNSKLVFIPDNSTTMEIVVHVSNFHYYKGGLLKSIYLGNAESIASYREASSRHTFLIFGVLFIMAVYHLALYILRSKERSSLFFALACAVFAVRIVSVDDLLMLSYYPSLSWEALVKIQYLSYYGSLAFFIFFLREMFSSDVSLRFVKVIVVIICGFTLATVMLPARLYSAYLSIPFEVVGILTMVAVIWFLIRAVKNKREGSLVIAAGGIVLLLSVVNDILYTSQIVSTGYYANKGFLVFIFAQAFALAVKFTNSFYAVETLTDEIRQSQGKLHDTITRLAESEKHSTVNTLVAGIAHDVSSPLGISMTAFSYLEDLMRKFDNEYQGGKLTVSDIENYIKETQESAQIIHSNLRRAAELVVSFRDLVADQYSEDIRVFNVREYLDDIVLSLKPKLNRNKHTVEISCPEYLSVETYPGAFSQVVINLILNSVMHGFEDMHNGVIAVEVSMEGDIMKLRCQDNGRGIAPEHLPLVFDPSFTTKKGRGGTGLGLHIVNTTVTQLLKGSIRCESIRGSGTAFYIEIPVRVIA